jgi:PAS domain S-box-containing protein
MRVMIVDDQASNLRIMKQLALGLVETGEVETFADPLVALAAVKADPPDLIVSDYNMPRMDGAAFVAALRELPECSDVPIVIVTIYEDRDFRYKALQAGATDFLLSPIDHQEFRIRLRNLFQLREHQRVVRNRALSLERKLVEDSNNFAASIRELEERLKQLIDAVPAMISVSNAERQYLYVNQTWCDTYGVALEDVIGRRPEDLFSAEHSYALAQADHSVLATGATVEQVEEEIRDRTGARKVLFTSKLPMRDAAGAVNGIIAVSLDMTSRKRAEEQLLSAMWRAEASERAKRAFLSQMSHELRTPLNAILGFSEIIAAGMFGPVSPEQYRPYAVDIRDSAKTLLEMVTHILAQADEEQVALEPRGEPVDLSGVAMDAAQTVRDRRGAAAHILCRIEPGLPAIGGDRRMIVRIVVDLLEYFVALSGLDCEYVLSVKLGSSRGAEIEVFANPQATDPASPGAGFAGEFPEVPLVRALVDLHGGTLALSDRGAGALHARVTLPAWRTLNGSTEPSA